MIYEIDSSVEGIKPKDKGNRGMVKKRVNSFNNMTVTAFDSPVVFWCVGGVRQ